MTLREFIEEKPLSYLWVCGIGWPTGVDFNQNTDTDDEEDYCDISDLYLMGSFLGLSGEVREELGWCWDGEGDVRDASDNSITQIVAR